MPMMGPNSSRSTVNILFAIQYNLLRIVLRRILADLTIECRRVAHVLSSFLGVHRPPTHKSNVPRSSRKTPGTRKMKGRANMRPSGGQVKMLSRKRIAARASVIQPNTEATRRIFNPPGVN